MKNEYFKLKLNNARFMTVKGEEYNGCLKINPIGNKKGDAEPFFVIAVKEGNSFLDIVSNRKIKFDDSFASRGNFFVEDGGWLQFRLDEKPSLSENHYMNLLNSFPEEKLDFFDEEASHILNYYNDDITCYDYSLMDGKEVAQELRRLDNTENVTAYIRELKKIETGEIAQKNAIIYLDARKKFIDRKGLADDDLAEKYINAFRNRYRKTK